MQPQPNLVSDKSPAQSLLTTVSIVIIGFVVVGQTLGLVIASLFYDGDLLNDINAFEPKPGLFYALMAVQGIGTFIGLIVFPYIQVTLLERKSIQAFFPPQPKLVFIALITLLLGFNFMIAISPIVEWNSALKFPEFMSDFEQWARNWEDKQGKITEAVTQFSSINDLMLGLLVIALFPAIGEELVFRGLIQNEIWRGTKNIHVAIWVSAIVFSAIHIQFFGFVPRVLLGALFGYLYYWSGNLLIPMLAHFFNNGLSVVALYLHQQEVIETNLEEPDSAPWAVVVFAVVLTTLLLVYLWRFFRAQRPDPVAY